MQNYTRVNIIKYIAPKIGCVPQMTCPHSPYQSKFQKSKVCKIN